MSNPHLPDSPFRAPMPFGGSDGAVIPHAGRYAREAVLVAFEMIGGVDALAGWAEQNRSEFYTKLLPKVITRAVEVEASDSLESLLLRLDTGTSPAEAGAPAEDADFEIVDDDT